MLDYVHHGGSARSERGAEEGTGSAGSQRQFLAKGGAAQPRSNASGE